MAITIRVPWEDPYNKDFMWNELLAWTCETFGLPNDDNWTYRPTVDFMDFNFPNEHNATLFQLKTNGIRMTNEELAVNFIGSLIAQ